MANISNSTSNTLITGTSSADSISNLSMGQYVTIESGSGNDTIQNSAYWVVIDTGAGNNRVTNTGGQSTINTGNGNNDIFNLQSVNDVLINGGSGNDYITSLGENTTINTGEGNNTVEILYGALINLGKGDNNVLLAPVSGTSTVNTSGGNDTIKIMPCFDGCIINGSDTIDRINITNPSSYYLPEGDFATVNTGEGNDIIYGYGVNDYKIIYMYKMGDGNDTIYKFGKSDELNISGSSYSSVVNGEDVIIEVGTGSITLKDAKGKTLNIVGGNYNTSSTGVTIDNSTANTLISGTSYADSIKNESVAGGVTIEAYAGDDKIANYAYNVTIKSGAGNDSIYNAANSTRIDTGDGSDTIKAYGDYVSVNAGTGNDYISGDVFDNGSTYEGGLGNDTIYMPSGDGNDTLKYSSGDGDDLVHYYKAFHAINIASGSVSNITGSGDDVVIKVGSGSMTLKDNKNLPIHIKNANGTDSVFVYNGTSTIAPVYSITSRSSLNGTDSSEYIFNKGRSSTVNASAGNDTIYNVGDYVSINGGAGNDSIVNVVNRGWGSTFTGGLGDDTVVLYNSQSSIIDYFNGDGNDVIIGLNWDSIRINDASYSSIISGNDIILKIGSGSMTLKDAKGDEDRFSVIGTLATLPTGLSYNKDKTALTASNKFTGSEIDLNAYASTVVTLNASAAKNSLNLIGNDLDNVIKGGVKADTLNGRKGNDTLTGGKGNDVFIYDGQGDDVITDYTPGQDTVMIADDQSITGSKLNGKDVILTVGDSSSNSIGNLTLKNAKGKAVKITKSTVSTAMPVIYGDDSATISIATNDSSLFAYWNDTIHKRGIVTAIDASKSTKDKCITNDYSTSMQMNGGSKNDTLYSDSGNDTLNGNAGNDSLNGFSGNDVLNGGAGNDTLYGNSGNDELTGGKGKDVFIASRDNDIVTDYKTGEDSIKLSGTTIKKIEYVGESNTDLELTFVEGGTLTVENVIPIKSVKKVPTLQSPQKVNIITDDDITTSQIYNLAAVTGGINTMSGGSGVDTLYGFIGDNILTGGKGKDVFVYSSGNDTITDYTVKQDSIILNAGSADDYTVVGDDAIFTVDSNNSLTVKNVYNKTVNINGEDVLIVDPKRALLDDKTSSPYSADNKVITIDASNRKKAIEITANDNDNTIIGGKGNDTLTGGDGADTFVYTSGYGNDIIKDYSASDGDIIKLGAKTAISGVVVSGNDMIFTIGKSKITLEGGATQTVTVLDSNNMKMTYEYYRPSVGFEERWFMEDDNFNSSEIDSIINNSSNLIGNDYNYNAESTWNKQLNQTLVTNSTKQQK